MACFFSFGKIPMNLRKSKLLLVGALVLLINPALAQDLAPNSITSSQILSQRIDNRPLEDILKAHKMQVEANGSSPLILKSSLFNLHKEDIPKNSRDLINKLEQAGFKAYVVGGGVRDFILGKHINDVDITTDATPYEIKELFANTQILGQGRRFLLALVPFANESFDIATFRKVPATLPNDDKLKADANGMLIIDNYFTKSAEDDANCRDLSINAIFFDVNKEELIDYHAGLYDLLIGHTIETNRSADLTFTQQPVRLLRAIRFAAKLDFAFSDDVKTAINRNKNKILNLSPKLLSEQTLKYFSEGISLKSYKLLLDYGLLKIIYPSLSEHIESAKTQEFLLEAFKQSDERYVNGAKDPDHVALSYLLYPQYKAECIELGLNNKKWSEHINVAHKIAKKILDKQSLVTLLNDEVKAKLETILTLQDELLDIESLDKMHALVNKDEFKYAFNLLTVRAKFEDNLKPFVDIYRPYYEASSK